MNDTNNHLKRRPKTTQVTASKSAETLIVLFNKPFNTLSQFTGEPKDSTLADFIKLKGIYPAGRLDKDSEGLMVLTNNGKLQNRISSPKHKMEKCYWAQVEGLIDSNAIKQLETGINLKDGLTKPAKARILNMPQPQFKLWPRTPPVRFRKEIPTSWIELCIKEGKNRQVRRMTAAVGFPTLRLIRKSIGNWDIGDLQPGQYRIVELNEG